jgi:ABC-type glutathione transport system ATPase component
VRAVDGVSLAISAGRTLALVGESGCGKTTVGKALLQLIQPTAGNVTVGGTELVGLRGRRLRDARRHMQMIFQDPFSSLNPRLRVGEIISEGMGALGIESDSRVRAAAVAALLQQVGLPSEAIDRYPHEFSGGQRQRIAIARALAVQPELLICDEPTSALDVSVQAQILNLLKKLQVELGVAYLFITHNFAVVEYLAHDVAVMYLGRIVEQGRAEEVLRSPRHPIRKPCCRRFQRRIWIATLRLSDYPAKPRRRPIRRVDVTSIRVARRQWIFAGCAIRGLPASRKPIPSAATWLAESAALAVGGFCSLGAAAFGGFCRTCL